MKPICPICVAPILNDRIEMHEAIITRGQAMGLPDNSVIMVKENCVIVHPGICHKEAHTEIGRKLCIIQLIKMETANEIETWLNQMKNHFTSHVHINQMIQLVTELSQGETP